MLSASELQQEALNEASADLVIVSGFGFHRQQFLELEKAQPQLRSSFLLMEAELVFSHWFKFLSGRF